MNILRHLTVRGISSVALVDKFGGHSYSDLAKRAKSLASKIAPSLLSAPQTATTGPRVGILCGRDSSYVTSLLATWQAGGVALPLGISHPSAELDYFLQDSGASLLLTTEKFLHQVEQLNTSIPVRIIEKQDYLEKSDHKVESGIDLPFLRTHRNDKSAATFLYTSGTTGRPKGVVITLGNLQQRIEQMVEMWEWTSSDVILQILPLHHVHGMENCLLTPLSVGATVIMPPDFNPANTWEQLLSDCPQSGLKINVFMAVPTVYSKLLEYWATQSREWKENARRILQNQLRLMVCGSAALPKPVGDAWFEASGHRLLERFGMTELGMALAPSLHGARPAGIVGRCFPGVEARIVDNEGKIVYESKSQSIENPDVDGELQISGPNVFREYWGKEDATKDTFTSDGYLKTGDTVKIVPIESEGKTEPWFQILGRTSVDIIKSGGYKLSALEIERVLLEHPLVHEIAVLGIDDEVYGQRVAALVMLPLKNENSELTLEMLREFAKEKMPPYALPTRLKVVSSIPHNAMGKINKKELLKKWTEL